MSDTFWYCEKLETVQNIPNSLIDMSRTFYHCSALKTVPAKIPDTVTNMLATFFGCELIETVPPIPNKVQDIRFAFKGCSALTGDLVINAENVTYYEECLEDTATNPGCELKLSGSCPQLNEILATATSENVSLKQ